MTERLHFHFSLSCIREGNGNPLQCSCLENPRDGGAWWAAVYGAAQSRTRLKRLSLWASLAQRSPASSLLAREGAGCGSVGIVHGVTKSQTRMRDFTFTFHFHALEKEMATHSSFLAWRIPGMWEPSWLSSMGSHRVGHD